MTYQGEWGIEVSLVIVLELICALKCSAACLMKLGESAFAYLY
jgi:hypothetical protein